MHRNSHSRRWPLIFVICWRFFRRNVKDCRYKFFVSCLARFSREFFMGIFIFFTSALFLFRPRSIISSHNMLQTIIIHKSIRWNSLEFELPWAHKWNVTHDFSVGDRAHFWEINQKFHETMEQPVIRASRGCNFPKQLSQPPTTATRVWTTQYRCQLECFACKSKLINNDMIRLNQFARKAIEQISAYD